MNDIPPLPDTPTEREALRLAVNYADQAVHCADIGSHRAAELAFYRSWQTLARHMLDDTMESENRRLAWDRVEALESKLDQIRDIIRDQDTEPLVALRIREVLDR